MLTEKQLKRLLASFWLLLGSITGLICLTQGLTMGFATFLSSSPSNILLFTLFCGSLLKLMLLLQGRVTVAMVSWGLLISEIISLNPLTSISIFLLLRKRADDSGRKLGVQEGLALVLLAMLGGLQLLLYTKI